MADFHGMKVAGPTPLPPSLDKVINPENPESPLFGQDVIGQAATTGVSAIDSAGFGLPGLLLKAGNSDLYKRIKASQDANPLATVAGEVGGMFTPLGAAGVVTKGLSLGAKALGAGKVAGKLAEASKFAKGTGLKEGLVAGAEQAIPRAAVEVAKGDQTPGEAVGDAALGAVAGGAFGAGAKALKSVKVPEGIKKFLAGKTFQREDENALLHAVGQRTGDLESELNDTARRMGYDPLGYTARNIPGHRESYAKFLANKGVLNNQQASDYVKSREALWDQVAPMWESRKPIVRSADVTQDLGKNPRINEYLDFKAKEGIDPNHPDAAKAIAANKRVAETEIYQTLKQADGFNRYFDLKQFVNNNLDKWTSLADKASTEADMLRARAMKELFSTIDAKVKKESRELLNQMGEVPGVQRVSTSPNGPKQRLGDELAKEYPYLRLMKRSVIHEEGGIADPLESMYGANMPTTTTNTGVAKAIGAGIGGVGGTALGAGVSENNPTASGIGGTIGGLSGLALSSQYPKIIPRFLKQFGAKSSAKKMATEGPLKGETAVPFMPKEATPSLSSRVQGITSKIPSMDSARVAGGLTSSTGVTGQPQPTQPTPVAQTPIQKAPDAVSGASLKLSTGEEVGLPGISKTPPGAAMDMVTQALERMWNIMDPDKYNIIDPITKKAVSKDEFFKKAYQQTNGFDPQMIGGLIFGDDVKSREDFTNSVKKAQQFGDVDVGKLTGETNFFGQPATMNPLSGFDPSFRSSLNKIVELVALGDKKPGDTPTERDMNVARDKVTNITNRLDLSAEQKKKMIVDLLSQGASFNVSMMQSMGLMPQGGN